jgi:hypothetical protein
MSLAQLGDGLSDARVSKIYDRLRKRMSLDEFTDFLTYTQPPAEGTRRGIYQKFPRALVFMVVSPNPNPRYATKFIKTQTAVPMERWEESERNRAVSDADPALDIFAELCRRHAQARREWKELQ